jgi:hypothetical protein
MQVSSRLSRRSVVAVETIWDRQQETDPAMT